MIIQTPTGEIIIIKGEKGLLECLSLGDYGKSVNLNQHKKVLHTDLLPLSEKWVCTISTQYGCSMGCTFCDVPKVGKGINATLDDILLQVETVRQQHPEIKSTKRFNIHFARMGEPSWNENVLLSANILKTKYPKFHLHPVVSTMMPKNNYYLQEFISRWVDIKNNVYGGEAGLQLSINSTDDNERNIMFNNNAHSINDISRLMKTVPQPKGRKYTLNFAIAGYSINAPLLAELFDPSLFVCKLTPMHKTDTAIKNGIKTDGDYTEHYPYQKDEEELKAVGFDVLVFIASKEEDESRITCGNAIIQNQQRLFQ